MSQTTNLDQRWLSQFIFGSFDDMPILVFYDMMESHKPGPSGEERTSKVACVSPLLTAPLAPASAPAPAPTPKGASEIVAKEDEK
ncbi:hypothetical protein Gotur_026647 [Gossypium turneri]